MASQRPKLTAFIPVRGGSKSIPLKNIAPLAGRPLIYWTASACSQSRAVERTFIATDDEQIAQCVRSLKLDRVEVIGRSAQTATDQASTESAMLEFAAASRGEYVALVQATSPLLRAEDIDGAAEKFFATGADSLLTAVRTKRFIWRPAGEFVEPANYDPARRPRRQEWAGQLVENGALYITSRKRLLETGCRLYGRIAAYEMPEETYFELDEPADWLIVEQLLAGREKTGGGR
ncbi:MAG: acylneuraminate cytidylyltransferase family protein [Planctomycetes bacterium]|nr:acylneuraminate cytidylyltransferase family protein [Planctomycetota bacterium]